MEKKGWYMAAYDIASPRRLAKVHRLLKKKGIAAQKSVFFIKGTESWVNRLLDQLAEVMDLTKDDLRAYPVIHPGSVWSFGPNPLAAFPVVDFETKKKAPVRKKKWNKFRELLGL